MLLFIFVSLIIFLYIHVIIVSRDCLLFFDIPELSFTCYIVVSNQIYFFRFIIFKLYLFNNDNKKYV